MRNKFPGTCYRCGKQVPAGEGHFERAPASRMTMAERARGAKFRVQHADCAIKYRGTDQHYLMPVAERGA